MYCEGPFKFFALVGLPKIVQSDQGTNFMSNVFQQVMFDLGIQQLKSSAYHPFDPGGKWDEAFSCCCSQSASLCRNFGF